MLKSEMVEILRELAVPGMNVMGNEWYEEDCSLTFREPDLMNIVETFHRRGLFSNEDNLTNAIRFGACCLIGGAMQGWDYDLDDMPEEAQALWDACNTPGDTASLPWAMFQEALPWLLYHAPECFWYAIVDAYGEGLYYETEIHCEWNDGLLLVQICFGWDSLCAVILSFEYAAMSKANFLIRLNRGLPDYMAVSEEVICA